MENIKVESEWEEPSAHMSLASVPGTDHSTAPSPICPFITEILSENEESDVECEEEEFMAVRSSFVPPVYRQLFPEDDLDDEDDEEEETAGAVPSSPWREGTTPPGKFDFTGASGLQVDVEGDTPLDYLRLMVDEDMVKSMVAETNHYASEMLDNKDLTSSSRFHQWVNTTVNEMWAFLGLIVGMGLIVIDNLEEYWSMDEFYKLPFFSSVMRKDRFCMLLSFFHLASNRGQPPEDHPDHDPIYKIRPFIDKLAANFRKVFLPGKNIAIDAAMVAWRGPLKFKVNEPEKPEKFGIKMFELCDSATAYCCNLEFYTGKTEASAHGRAFDVVARLIHPYTECGRILYVDNCYTSPDLFSYLKDHGTLACGTMRPNRKNGPPKHLTPKIKKGDSSVAALTNGHLNLLRFMDRKEVIILTTAHGANKVSTGKTNAVTKDAVMKLEAVHDYNQFMGAVDRCNQMVSSNSFKRRTLKWWKKAFFHMFALGVLNAYIVHKVTAVQKLSHRMFRRQLAKQLVQFVPLYPEVRPRLGPGQSSLFRLTARHFPHLIPPKPGNKRQNPQRNCVVCTVPTRRAMSRYQCPSCDVGLHPGLCFETYHTKKNFKGAVKRKREEPEKFSVW